MDIEEEAIKEYVEDIHNVLHKYWDKQELDWMDITSVGLAAISKFAIISIRSNYPQMPIDELKESLEGLMRVSAYSALNGLEELVEEFDELLGKKDLRYKKVEGNVIHFRTAQQLKDEC